MAVRNCAQIETNPQPDLIINVIVVEEADYDFLKSIWSVYFPTQRIQWLDELEKDPNSTDPNNIWMGWVMDENGYWYNPNAEMSESSD